MNVNEIFTPNRYPEHTYVTRDEKNLEKKLRQGLRTPGEVVSLSGPSKSGKTVLVQNVVDQDSLIIVQGSSVESSEDLWNEVLDEIGVPSSTESHSNYHAEGGGSFKTGLKSLLPGLGASAEAKGQMKLSGDLGKSKHYDRKGLRHVVKDIKNDKYVILVDDFHYISREAQKDIAEVIKEAARQDISMCVALVPHRSDDLVRANSDLRGRVRGINVDYWNEDDLEKIASKGFDLLNVGFPKSIIQELARESAGSPQLMQRLCLQACFDIDISEPQSNTETISEEEVSLEEVFSQTADFTDHGSTFDVLNSGPKTRGTERVMYEFDNGTGDVYRCILRAIAADPPKLSFEYDELKSRTEEQCTNKAPSGSSITGSCQNMDELIKTKFPDERALDWDQTKQYLSLPDPYLLFYLRWSDRLGVHNKISP